MPRGEDVRAPGEAPGLFAVESAVDELARRARGWIRSSSAS